MAAWRQALIWSLVSVPGTSLGSADRFEISLTAADGRLLVQEAFAQITDSPLSLTLSPGGKAFLIQSPRIVVNASAQSAVLDCPLRISGIPAIVSNRFALRGTEVSTDGVVCETALAALRSRLLDAIAKHPWNLAERLARASIDPALRGPRLPGTECVREDQIRLAAFRPVGAAFLITVEVSPAPPGRACP